MAVTVNQFPAHPYSWCGRF